MRGVRREHLPGRVFDEVGARVHRGSAGVRGRGQHERRNGDRRQAPHLTRIFWPIVSAFELTPGFSACSASTVVLNFVATTPNVSPDWIT